MPTDITKPAVPPTATPKDEEKGFSLRFESNAALDSLLTGNQFQLYAQIDRVFWGVYFAAGKPRFRPTPSPARFHLMGTDTVPEPLVAALRRDARVRKKTVVAWGVTLPPRIANQVRRKLTGSTGGRLVAGNGLGDRRRDRLVRPIQAENGSSHLLPGGHR